MTVKPNICHMLLFHEPPDVIVRAVFGAFLTQISEPGLAYFLNVTFVVHCEVHFKLDETRQTNFYFL